LLVILIGTHSNDVNLLFEQLKSHQTIFGDHNNVVNQILEQSKSQ